MVGILQLGKFKFQPSGPSYESLQHMYAYKWTEKEICLGPNKQYWGGKQGETITLDGSIYMDLILPRADGIVSAVVSTFNSVAAIRNSFDKLDAMASAGQSYPLVDTTGRNYGFWVILGFNVNNQHMWTDGIPRVQTFSLNLRKDLQSDPEEIKEYKISKRKALDIAIVKVRDIINR